METLSKLLVIISIISPSLASENGRYYICDTAKLASENQCIFALSGNQPDTWTSLEEHNIDRGVGPEFSRGIKNKDATTMLGKSPKPWTNGDRLVASDEPITQDNWSYTLIFELMAPLRDMAMYRPGDLDEATWNMYTKAMTDCNVKTVDYISSRAGGMQLSTGQVYEYIKNPNNQDIHHYVLQYLEEGSIDLVCLSTDLEMDHCDGTRDASGAAFGDHCNCWFDAYYEIYGECPVVDTTFKHCSKTAAPTVCGDDSPNEPNPPEPTEQPTEAPTEEPTEEPNPPAPTDEPNPPAPPNPPSPPKPQPRPPKPPRRG